MKKITKLFAWVLFTGLLIFSTGCNKDPLSTKTWAILFQDNVTIAHKDEDIHVDYLLGILNINIPLTNITPQTNGLFSFEFSNIATSNNFATGSIINLPIPSNVNNNDVVALDYKNYYTVPNYNPSLREFDHDYSGTLKITNNDQAKKRFEGILDVDLYDGSTARYHVHIKCYFHISY